MILNIIIWIIAVASVASIFVLLAIVRSLKGNIAISDAQLKRTRSEIEGIYSEISFVLGDIQRGALTSRCSYRGNDIGEYDGILDSVNDIIESTLQYIDQAPYTILTTDLDTKILYANRRVINQGYRPEDLVGANLISFFDKKEVEEHMKALHKIKNATDTSRVIRPFVTKGGKRIWEDHSLWPIEKDGKIVGYVDAASDISDIVSIQERQNSIGQYRNQEISRMLEAIRVLDEGTLRFDYFPTSAVEGAEHAYNDYLQISRLLQRVADGISEYVSDIINILRAFLRKDFSVGLANEFKGDFSEVENAITEARNLISDTLEENEYFFQLSTQISKQIMDSSSNLVDSFNSQMPVLGDIATLLNQLSEVSMENAGNASMANGFSQEVQEAANSGSASIDHMIESMENIRTSSIDVSNIVKIVDDIAFQTNLLSINAMIEAARAGEHGKSFAIVADEVKGLAQRSAKSAKEISDLMEKSMLHVNTGVNTTIKTKEGFLQIVELIDRIAGTLSNITDSCERQSEKISKLSIQMEDLKMLITEDTQIITKVVDAAKELEQSSRKSHGL